MKSINSARLPIELNDPFAPPDWRWMVANAIVRGDRKMKYYQMDPNVVAAVGHLRARNRHQRSKLDPAIDEAWGIFQDPNSLLKWEIEARLVASQNDAEIGLVVTVRNEVISRYRALFFHAPPGATDYLLTQVIGRGPSRGFENREVRQFWAWSAMGGPILLEHLVKSFRQAVRPGETPTLGVYLRPSEYVSQEVQGYIATAVIPRSPEWASWLVEHQMRLIEISAIPDPDSRTWQLDRLRGDLIRVGRSVLAGVTSPPGSSQTKRKPKTVKRKERTTRQSSQTRDRPTFQAQLMDLVRSI